MMLRRLFFVLGAITALTAFAFPGRPLKTDESMPWLPEYVDMLLGIGAPGVAASYTGACDTFSDGGKACYSVDQSWVASYAGPLFELAQQAPSWTGAGYISGTTFTVSSTATGAFPTGWRCRPPDQAPRRH